ncbi:MAG: hypothetical protein Kow00109_11500 [Acidobacteriota bacterium]
MLSAQSSPCRVGCSPYEYVGECCGTGVWYVIYVQCSTCGGGACCQGCYQWLEWICQCYYGGGVYYFKARVFGCTCCA